MDDAKINLVAALILLVATCIPIATNFLRWASGKGILGLVFSISTEIAALLIFLTAMAGQKFFNWPSSVVVILVMLYLFLIIIGFVKSPVPLQRKEVAILIVQVVAASSIALRAQALSEIDEKLHAPPTTARPSPSAN
ncbi:MAG: hypothetical protein H0X34_18610 [Chthoniobacterales bacterium]|nr:hypothetical protein [Chthoniobacterales bacterium]